MGIRHGIELAAKEAVAELKKMAKKMSKQMKRSNKSQLSLQNLKK
jgi:chaperonin GroEL (HSP60 family)